jgi:hypothetical protein
VKDFLRRKGDTHVLNIIIEMFLACSLNAAPEKALSQLAPTNFCEFL